MDRNEPAGGAARPADQELVSTGSFAGGPSNAGRRHPRTVGVLLLSAGVLVGAFLWHSAGRGADRTTPRAATASLSARTAGRPMPMSDAAAGTPGQAFDIRSGTVTGRLTVRQVQRVQTDPGNPALGVIVHLEESSGVETVTPDSFVADTPDGLTTPAGAVTVLAPGPQVTPSSNGFRITAPAAVDIEVLLRVPPGDHVVHLLDDATGETLARFPVQG